MKFYFRVSKEYRERLNSKAKKGVRYRLCGYNNIRQRKERALSPIPLIDISEFLRALDIPKIEPPRLKRKKAFGFYKFIASFQIAVKAFAKKLRHRHSKRKPLVSPSMLAGLLTSALLITFLSGTAAVFPYLFKYTRSYTPVTIPDFTIYSYDELLTVLESYPSFNFVVEFKENLYAEGGAIISQLPRADAKRRIYNKDEKLTVDLTVCSYAKTFTMNDYIGGSARNAELELRNLGIKVKTIKKYSNTIPAGRVIATSHQIGETIYESDEITLTVSRGKRISYSLLPNLVGLSETSAINKLKRLGFSIGEIKYSHSESTAGTVIAQSKKRGSSLPQGTTVSLTISTGSEHTERTVPDLLGMTLGQAKTALRDVGLTVGNVYYINEENENNGEGESESTEGLTVVKQTPASNTAISSSIVSVDLYLG